MSFGMRVTAVFLLLLSLCEISLASNKECVVLLHGLARVSNSMVELERKLARSGFLAVNITYP
ncbi:MAG TPA: acetyltransferase, partial [Gammaproteobacteria bacterium]|nr:acetyltransferase [Gammaproteobacteria bacterium]